MALGNQPASSSTSQIAMADSIVVEIQPASRKFTRFKELHLARTIEAASSKFSLTVGAKSGRLFKCGQEVRILLAGVPMLAGYVDAVVDDFDSDGGLETRVLGRDVVGDAIDCSAVDTQGEWRNADLLQIAGSLCKGLAVLLSVPGDGDTGEPIPLFKLHDGEEIVGAIERLCRMRGLLCYSDGFGAFVLERPGAQPRTSVAPSGIVEGRNLKAARRVRNDSERFSEVRVRGQSRGEDNFFGAVAAHVEATARDRGIDRFRPLVIMAEGAVTEEDAQQRAEWEVTVRAARADRLRCQVFGWRTPNGSVWPINRTIPVQIPSMRIDTDLLVVSVEYHRTSGGTWAELDLARSDAFIPQPEIPPVEAVWSIDESAGDDDE